MVGAILAMRPTARKRGAGKPAVRSLNIAAVAAVQTAMVLPIVVACLLLFAAPALGAPPPRLVVLTAAGAEQGGLPVLARRPPGEIDRVLSRGFSGRLLRLYAMQQEYLRRETATAPEPAYLLLSTQQGGFPRFGFVLDGTPKPDAGYVDLHRSSLPAGRFGAMDQIFPHELLHVIVRQLAGEPRESGANQVHAVGVRTDPVTAFQEGFAEHVQIVCVDDPDAHPATRALRDDGGVRARAELEFDRYRRGVGGRYLFGSPPEIRFLLWFSSAEQVMRYHAVKANLFARQAPVPERLLRRGDKYAAYLFQHVMPGGADDPVKPPGVLLSTEGVVAHLFWRWVTHPGLQHRYRDEAFYARYGETPSAVGPIENAYLKIFHAIRAGRAGDTVSFLRAYIGAFPDEAPLVQQIVLASLEGQDISDAPELWLANPALQTGTSLFDQFRSLPRVHTFDANAASMLDWLALPGATPETAFRLLRGAPYRDMAALLAQAGPDAGLRQQIADMAVAMKALRSADEEEDSLSLSTLVRSYVWRLLAYVLVSAAAGAWVAHVTCAVRWRWAAPCGLVSALLVFGLAWVVTSPVWWPLAAPLAVGGIPAAVWAGLRRRSWRASALAAAAWVVASLPAAVLSSEWW
jgi:hypothetical protein